MTLNAPFAAGEPSPSLVQVALAPRVGVLSRENPVASAGQDTTTFAPETLDESLGAA